MSVTYDEAYLFLSDAGQQRRNLRDSLTSTAVPDLLRSDHDAVITVIDRAVRAVQSAYDGLQQSQDYYCTACYYRDTPGWQQFQSESGVIGKRYAAAIAGWEQAAAGAEDTIGKRALPAQPDL